MTAISRRQLLAWCLVAFALGAMTGYAAVDGYLHGRAAAQVAR